MLARSAIMGGVVTPTYVDDVFSTYLYTGNGSTQTITNGIDLAGKGGMVWIKQRDGTAISGGNPSQHTLLDSARGSKFLSTNSTDSQTTTSASNALTSTGFTVAQLTLNGSPSGLPTEANYNAVPYVSWTFRKAAKFFDVVSHTAAATPVDTVINHSLGVAPGMVVIKTLGTGTWFVIHRSLSTTNSYLTLNSTGAAVTSPGNAWVLGATSITLPAAYQYANQQHIIYLFAHDTATDGIVQCGSFTTNAGGSMASAVNLGWEPQYLLIKNATASTPVGAWLAFDVMRGMPNSTTASQQLYLNTSGAEDTGNNIAWRLSPTGFIHQDGYLAASSTYIYLAIRRPNKPPTTGTQVYNAVQRSGTGADATVTTGNRSDLVVIKSQTNNGGGGGVNTRAAFWFDRLRGATKGLDQAGTAAESTYALTGFDVSNGFKLGADPDNGTNSSYFPDTYINYVFSRAPGVFDVVCYTGTGSAHTEAHQLGVAPELIIVKVRSTGGTPWVCYCQSIGNANSIYLNMTNAPSARPTDWDSATPTESGFRVGASGYTNNITYTHVAYLFATKAGISKVGSYTGNGSSQTINCGFSAGARFILIKRTDSTGSWYSFDTVRGIVAGNDPVNQMEYYLAPDQMVGDHVDPDNSGFIVNQNGTTNINVNAATYIYLAFA